jgi:hypothetical protein
MSLARASDDPALKQRYQDLALEFAQNAVANPTSTFCFPARVYQAAQTQQRQPQPAPIVSPEVARTCLEFADFSDFEIVHGTR